jgi:hypothetical protein
MIQLINTQKERNTMKRITCFLVLLFLLCACAPAQATAVGPVIQSQATEKPAPVTVAPTTTTNTTVAPTAPIVPIAHAIIPVTGAKTPSIAHDNEESTTFESKGAREGDDFSRNRFERPFTSNTMEYLPQLDITDFSIAGDNTFFYVEIQLAGLDATKNSLTGSYGVEIDRNRDGRGEILITTTPPYTTEFSTNGVAVYVDTNGDIGGKRAGRPDDGYAGNGYEGVLFDLSRNINPKDPDLAWVRFIDGKQPAVEIAFKKWVFQDGKDAFFWNVWASGTKLDPSKFNLHDTMTVEQAGAANAENPNYPIKKLAAIDNSCRIPYGYEAWGSEPMSCLTKVEVPDLENTLPIPFCDQYPIVCANISLK